MSDLIKSVQRSNANTAFVQYSSARRTTYCYRRNRGAGAGNLSRGFSGCVRTRHTTTHFQLHDGSKKKKEEEEVGRGGVCLECGREKLLIKNLHTNGVVS